VFRSGLSTNLRSVLAAGSLAWTVDGFFGCRIPLSRSQVWGCTRRGFRRVLVGVVTVASVRCKAGLWRGCYLRIGVVLVVPGGFRVVVLTCC